MTEKSERVFKTMLTMNNGLKIPQIGFGTYQVKDSKPFYWALKHGYRHLDTAAFYGNEHLVGLETLRAMKDFNISREEIFITSKIPPSY